MMLAGSIFDNSLTVFSANLANFKLYFEDAGVTIPKGATGMLLLASGSRDPARCPNPDRFDPDRTDNEHFGIHYCVGAPLARMETHIALSALARRLVNPRLVTDPPPYGTHTLPRGPQHLPVTFDHIGD